MRLNAVVVAVLNGPQRLQKPRDEQTFDDVPVIFPLPAPLEHRHHINILSHVRACICLVRIAKRCKYHVCVPTRFMCVSAAVRSKRKG